MSVVCKICQTLFPKVALSAHANKTETAHEK